MKIRYLYIILVVVFTACNKEDSHVSSPKDADKIQLFQELLSTDSGIDFTNKIIENETINILKYLYYYNGSGVAIGDVDNDGLPDIYLGSTIGENKLYLNKGDLKFEDITKRSGVKGDFGITTGVCFVDINNDGLQDIYVCKSGNNLARYRTNQLFINNGDLTFSEKGKQFGLNDNSYSNQAYFYDLDKDGDLDMYLVNHPLDWMNVNKVMTGEQERQGFEYGYSDKLYFQEDGKFVDRTNQSGILNRTWGLSAAIGDYNEDGLPDIYVANDFIKPDFLYINNGDGTFTDSIKHFFKHISFYSMGTDLADIDNDGYNDLFVADMAMPEHERSKSNMGSMSQENFQTIIRRGYHIPYSSNTLQLSSSKGDFVDIAQASGVNKTDWSWAPLLADFDNDGYKDLFVSNGILRDIIDNDFLIKKNSAQKDQNQNNTNELVSEIPQTKVRNYLFRNTGDRTFDDLSEAWGIETKTNSNGAAYADLDNDGDLDLVVNNLNEKAQVFRNTTSDSLNRNYISIRLIGPSQNIHGIGAKVELFYNDKYQRADMNPNRGYMSSVDPKLHFGMGYENEIDEVRVMWPDKKISRIYNPDLNKTISIKYKGAKDIVLSAKADEPLFSDISDIVDLPYEHRESDYNDFQNEILLPHQLSRLGPFISVADVNGDQIDDIFIGGGANQSATLLIQDNGERFSNSSEATLIKDKGYEDMRSHFFDADADGDLDLYVVSGSNEFSSTSMYQDRIYINDGKGEFTKGTGILPTLLHSGSDVSSGDLDNDGDEDLLIGGRVVPGKYPLSPRSYILENRGGKFVDVSESWAPSFLEAGMVTDLDIVDYDNDKDLDIVAVGEWMPISIFRNTEGRFENITPSELQENTGWWTSINHADIDRDGDMDFVAGNIGKNNKYHPSKEKPLELYYNDFDENGRGDIVLSKKSGEESLPIRGRECSSQQMPFIEKKYPDYKSFAKASLPEIYSEEKLSSSLHLSASIFESVILRNSGNGTFKVEPLPFQAQISPINVTLIKDLNGDNVLDIIGAGNNLSTETETIRYDAGTGICLMAAKGNSFNPVSSRSSGLHLNLDVKDMKFINLANHGLAIIASNNNDKLSIYKVNSN